MTKIRPYLSLDLETTGLNVDKVQILQIGWVIDDGVSPLEKLRKGSVIIKNEIITYGEDFALGMNGWIFQEISKKQPKYPVQSLELGLMNLMLAIEQTGVIAEQFDKTTGEKNPSRKVQLAGKNIGPFDWAIINNVLKNTKVPLLYTASEFINNPGWQKRFVDHKFIDVGAMFFSEFGKNSGLDKINKLIGWTAVSHDAVEDAMNVVAAVRYKSGLWPEVKTTVEEVPVEAKTLLAQPTNEQGG